MESVVAMISASMVYLWCVGGCVCVCVCVRGVKYRCGGGD